MLSLHAWDQGKTDRNLLELRQNEAAKWNQIRHEQETHVDTLDFNYIRSGRLTNWAKIKTGPNYITAAHAFVKATLRLELRAPLVARNYQTLPFYNEMRLIYHHYHNISLIVIPQK